MSDIFEVKSALDVDGKNHNYYSLAKLSERFSNIETLPFCMKIVLEIYFAMKMAGKVSAKVTSKP